MRSNLLRPVLLILATSLLATACGGGGGGGDKGNGPVTMSGVVATSMPLGGAEVVAKCASGTGTVTASAGGIYTMTIASAALPCLLEATGTSANKTIVLHSVAVGANHVLTVDITELTDLAVADMTGSNNLAAYFANVDQTTLSTQLTLAGVAAAQTTVLATLQSAAIPISSIGSLFTDPIVLMSSGTGNNAYGAALLSLDNALVTGGTTFSQLSATLADSSTNATATPTPSAVPSLPAKLLLAPAAATCSALRTGNYQFVWFDNPGTGAADVDQGAIDAQALTATLQLGGVTSFSANGSCRFLAGDGHTEFVVSQAGVGVMRSYNRPSAGNYTLGFFFPLPLQPDALSEVAQSTENIIGLDLSGTSNVIDAIADTVNSNGSAITASTVCSPFTASPSNCVNGTNSSSISVDASGGFVVSSTASASRVFLYRAGGGHLLGVYVDAAGSGRGGLFTPQQPLAAPALNTPTTTWNFYSDLSLSAAAAIDLTTATTTGVSGTTLTRSVNVPGSTTVTFTDTVTQNVPLPGIQDRPPATVTASDSSSVNVPELLSLPLTGSGLSVGYLPATSRLVVSVEQ